MTFYYVHPNGEVVTEASNRQDKNTIANMLRYYYCYKYMAIHDNNGQFAEMVKLIERTSTLEQLAGYLEYFLPDEKLWVELPIGKALPVNYAKVFPYSGVVRIRRGNWDSTILANNAGFLTFQKDSAVLTGIRFASSFFGKGQFMSEKILQKEDYYILTQNLEGPYFQPIDNKYIDADGDWEKMPRINRKQSEVQKLEYVVKVKELKAGIEIEININGTGNVPVTVELIFRKGGQFDGVTKFGIKENTYLLENGTGTYTVGNDTITFGPGKILHKTLQLRGTLPFADAPTVYLTGFTPFNHKINIY